MWTEIWLYEEIGKEPRRIAMLIQDSEYKIGMSDTTARFFAQDIARKLFGRVWEWKNDDTLFGQHIIEIDNDKRVLEVR